MVSKYQSKILNIRSKFFIVCSCAYVLIRICNKFCPSCIQNDWKRLTMLVVITFIHTPNWPSIATCYAHTVSHAPHRIFDTNCLFRQLMYNSNINLYYGWFIVLGPKIIFSAKCKYVYYIYFAFCKKMYVSIKKWYDFSSKKNCTE